MNRKTLRRLSATLLLLAAAPLRAQSNAPATVPAGGPATPANAFVQLRRGDAAPEFTVIGPKGEAIRLSDFRGKIVIVDVSATWCGPCQAAMPNNDRVFRKYADQGVVLLGVTASDTRAAYDGWIARNAEKYRFTMAFDPAGKDGWEKSVFNRDYHVTGFPTMFVIGREGKISEAVHGGGPGEDYRLEYALARAGARVDLASLPPEPKKDPNAPKSIPAVGKTPAMAKGAVIPAMGMGAAAPAGGGSGFTPDRFGSVARGTVVPDFTVTGADGKPVRLSSFRGQPLLLQFCTSNGPQPWLPKIAATYREQGLAAFVVFSASERDAFDRWVSANPNPGFAVAWDPAGKAWGENVTNTVFGVGMYPATAVLNAKGELWSGTIGMGDKVVAMVYSMLARSGLRLTEEHLNALVAAGGAMRAAGMNSGGGSGAAAALPARPATLAAGAEAPDFVSVDLDGKEVRLADFQDKIVILDFWATWCGPCIASFPHTQKIAAQYKDQGVVVLAAGTSDTIKAFQEWIPKNQPRYPDLVFVYDRHERGASTFEERASAKFYRVQGIPTQFVIGRDRKIAAVVVGNGGEGDARTEAALAKLGVKVDDAIVAKGQEQTTREAAEEAKRAAAAQAEAANPRPPFLENYGKLKKGEAVPDLDLQDAAGRAVKLSALTQGKTAILAVSGGGGPYADGLPFYESWSRRYADQGVIVVALSAYTTREDFDAWRKANAGKFSFPVVFDPAGRGPQPGKPFEDFTPDEKQDFMKRQRDHMAKVAPLVFTGGVMAPVPHAFVIDAQGNMVGICVGGGAHVAQGLGNMLLRAGIKLAPEDMPKKIFTAEETKPPAPEPKREMIKIGALAPDFLMTDVTGKPVKISDYRGKVIVLDFWATWCGPCLASMPHTQEVAKTYRDQGVVVIGACTSDDRAKFEAWVAANQASYPDFILAHDPLERKPDRASAKLYGVGGIPQQFIINREGRIAAAVTGYLKGEVLLDAALAQAGIQVDPAIVTQAEADRKKRDAMR